MIDVNDFANRILTCIDCGNKFTFEAGEQAFYFSKGLAPPKRCTKPAVIKGAIP